MNPQFSLFIPSKKRYQYLITSKYLSYLKVPHTLVIEEQEYSLYKKAIKDSRQAKLLILDKKYQENYKTLDNLGLNKPVGAGACRNFIWDYSIDKGQKYHWVMDDNIHSFYRFNKNKIIKVSTGAIFKAMEDFCLRYENVYMAGPQYFMFTPRKSKLPPFVINTRIYSCNFIKNDIPFRWRGRYNEDTILSLDILKAGFCTIQFNAFLQGKASTQSIPGGNTSELYLGHERKKGERYSKKGTIDKSKMLYYTHPEVVKIKWKYGRVHHQVNYLPFKKNRLIENKNIKINKNPNNYGMKLKSIKKNES